MVNISLVIAPLLTQQIMSVPEILTPHNIDHELSLPSYLFPSTHNYTMAFTTSSYLSDPQSLPYIPNMHHIALNSSSRKQSDTVLGIHKSYGSRAVVPAPLSSDPEEKAWEAFYPQGSINPNGKIVGGFGFYMTGPEDFKKRLRDANEVLFGYSVLFEKEWLWAKGGKLPGIYGGVGDSAYGCTGGRTENRTNCFNLRLMWRQDGDGELYAYLPLTDSNIFHLTKVPPVSIQNPDFGFSVGRGAWTFQPGRWTTITERVKLNQVGKSDGEIEIRVDGVSVINVSGLEFRTTNESHIQGLHVQTFFGGKDPDWASPKDQRAWFADVSGAIIG